MIRERCELLTAHQLCIVVGAVPKCTADLVFTTGSLVHSFTRVVDTYASNKHASMGVSGVDASRTVLRVAKPPGLFGVSLGTSGSGPI